MVEKEVSILKTGIISGVIVFGILVIYFMIMRMLNLSGSALAWGFNFIILLTGIFSTYRYYRSKTKPNVEYLPGMLLGCITTLMSTVSFTVFVYLYFSSVGVVQLEMLKDNVLFMGSEISPVRLAGATIIEGISSGFVITFIIMQYYKSGFRRSSRDVSIQG